MILLTTERGYKIEVFSFTDGIINILYYDSHNQQKYRSWKISKSIFYALLLFWGSYSSGSFPIPVIKRVPEGEFRMLSEKTIFLKEADPYGNLKMIGANLPVDLVKSLYDYFLTSLLDNNFIQICQKT